jgi:hypothetical protein
MVANEPMTPKGQGSSRWQRNEGFTPQPVHADGIFIINVGDECPQLAGHITRPNHRVLTANSACTASANPCGNGAPGAA